MPKLKINEPWVNGFKTAIRESTAKGWSVREHRGQARLEVRTPDGMKSAQLLKNNIPFSYTARDMADILIRVRNIYVEMSKNGGDFDSAVAVCAGLAPKLTYSHDWDGAKVDFEKYKKEIEIRKYLEGYNYYSLPSKCISEQSLFKFSPFSTLRFGSCTTELPL